VRCRAVPCRATPGSKSARCIIALAVHIRAGLARTSEPFFCSRWHKGQRESGGRQDRKTEGSRESKSSGYVAALERPSSLPFPLSVSLSLCLSASFRSRRMRGDIPSPSFLPSPSSISIDEASAFPQRCSASMGSIDQFAETRIRTSGIPIVGITTVHARADFAPANSRHLERRGANSPRADIPPRPRGTVSTLRLNFLRGEE